MKKQVEEEQAVVEEKKKKNIIFPIVLILILGAGGFYAFKKISFSKHHETTDNAQVDGNINPVIPRLPGYVIDVRVVDNQLVKIGDTLVILDDRDIRIRILQAEAALQTAIANVGVVRANVKAAKANSKTAQSGIAVAQAGTDVQDASIEAAKVRVWKANQDYIRFSNLLADGTVTQQQFDGIKAEKEIAEKTLEVMIKQAEISKQQTNVSQNQSSASLESVNIAAENITVAEAAVKARQADVDMAKLQLTFVVITAPADGQVSRKNVQVGQFVQPGQNLFSIVNDKGGLWITANFKETQLEKMSVGQKVDVEIDAFGNKILKGHIESISSATGAKFALLPPDNASGNFVKVVQRIPVKIVLDNANDKLLLRAGMNAKVTVNID